MDTPCVHAQQDAGRGEVLYAGVGGGNAADHGGNGGGNAEPAGTDGTQAPPPSG
ncbi:MAG: hypothetical protein UHH87_06080 [Akkermansia sp.]|nr:hypothetical protein [Akkermansia sp.]